MDTNIIHTGDCFDVLTELPDESVHAVVSDPPYGLNFMPNVTNGWDDFEPKEYQEWCEKWARECLRVLKPGGHMLAFSGNRTHHRLFTGVEDAGFEIRDTLTWHYGSGFPKAADVSKVIDKRADAEREVVGEDPHSANRTDREGVALNSAEDGSLTDEGKRYVTAPATDAARKWDGWKTGLKPATEFVVMARKPFSGATVDSVLENGTGALNIDACRVEGGERPERTVVDENTGSFDKYGDYENETTRATGTTSEGRYPANVVFDETAADALDARNESTVSSGGRSRVKGTSGFGKLSGDENHNEPGDPGFGDEGGPSRYFYTSKASRSERTNDGAIENDHPTVKPRDLMEWLIKLVTREGQIVLDPFAGSGTTCMAAKGLGREFVGIERQAKYADVARVRCGLTPDDPSVVRGDDAQRGLEAFDP